ncbi:mannitol-1-phosphate 5-dehydrogenase [Escherichia coli]|nr:mannitol-1-phosphate 5-dehydrogenase [Escherichia coli]
MWCTVPDATLTRLIRPTNRPYVGRIRRSRRIRHLVHGA